MLNISKFIDLGGTVTPLTKNEKKPYLQKVQSLNEDGLRVIGVAQRPIKRRWRIFSQR